MNVEETPMVALMAGVSNPAKKANLKMSWARSKTCLPAANRVIK